MTGTSTAGRRMPATDIAVVGPPLATLADLHIAVWDRLPDLGNFRRKPIGNERFVVVDHRPDNPAAGAAGGRPPLLYRRGPAEALHPPLMRPP